MLQLETTVAEIATSAVVAADAGAATRTIPSARIPNRIFFIWISLLPGEAVL
jgi:hypothetical protein